MADAPFDRTVINPLERPITDDINQLQSTLDYALRTFLAAVLPARTSNTNYGGQAVSGFVGEGFKVVAEGPPSTSVRLKAGLGLITNGTDVPVAISGVVGVDDRSALKPVVLLSDVDVAVPAPPGSNKRIDLIEVTYKRRIVDPRLRDVFDTIGGQFEPNTVDKTLSFAVSSADLTYGGVGAINYVTGTPGASPVAPTVDSGYVAVAYVLVDSGATSYANIKIADMRKVLTPGGVHRASVKFRLGADGTTVDQLEIQGPAGVPIYVTQDGVATSRDVRIFVLGNFKYVHAAVANEHVQKKTFAVVSTGLPPFDSAYRGGAVGDINNALCVNQDTDPPGSSVWLVNTFTGQQKTTANYDFTDPLSFAEVVNLELTMVY